MKIRELNNKVKLCNRLPGTRNTNMEIINSITLNDECYLMFALVYYFKQANLS